MLGKVVKGIGTGLLLTGGFGVGYLWSSGYLPLPKIEESEITEMSLFSKHFNFNKMDSDVLHKLAEEVGKATDNPGFRPFFNLFFEDGELLKNTNEVRMAAGFRIDSPEDYILLEKYLNRKKENILTLTTTPKTKCLKVSLPLLAPPALHITISEYYRNKMIEKHYEAGKKDYILLRLNQYNDKNIPTLDLILIEDTKGPFGFSRLPPPDRL